MVASKYARPRNCLLLAEETNFFEKLKSEQIQQRVNFCITSLADGFSIGFTAARMEAYFYDLEAVVDEADDPLKAVIFRWPMDLDDDHVIMVAGHLVRSIIIS